MPRNESRGIYKTYFNSTGLLSRAINQNYDSSSNAALAMRKESTPAGTPA